MILVDFIIPTYTNIGDLKVILASLKVQSCPYWVATVVVDGIENAANVEKLIKEFGDERIRMKVVEVRSNNWGHTPREVGKQSSEADYIIMTGDDNYYVPTFVEELRHAVKNRPGMVYWDMVHNHYDYQLFVCTPGFNQIDIGAFATRSDLAKQVQLKTSYAADGEFVEEFKQRFPTETILKIKKVLYVHN